MTKLCGGVRGAAAGTAELRRASRLWGMGSRVGPRRGRLSSCDHGGTTDFIGPSSYHEAARIGGISDYMSAASGAMALERRRRYVTFGGFFSS